MRKLLSLFVVLCLAYPALSQPTDNPVRSFYANLEAFHWTDTLPWHRVLNIQNYQDTSWDAAYKRAKADALQMGGATIYFPAGTYRFNKDLILDQGIIIRGDNPSVKAAKDSAFAPPTRFVFPEYVPSFTGNGTPNATAFKSIKSDSNIFDCGIVYVDINRAGIALRTVKRNYLTINGKSTYHMDEQSRNVIVFGTRTNNVADPDGGIPKSWMNGWQRFVSRFTSNIRIYSHTNAIVSNNRINDFEINTVHPIKNESYFQPGYIVKDKNNNIVTVSDSTHAPFNYTDHYGLSVNRKSAITSATPKQEPDLFRTGIEVCDNWVYSTMRVGIYASGYGLKVNRNIKLDKAGKTVHLRPQGDEYQSNNSATYENRGIDISGWYIQANNNQIEVRRHRIRSSGYSSVDGEGIMMQECCGGTRVNGVEINDNTSNSYIGLYKMRDIYNVAIKRNNLQNKEFIMVDANTNWGSFSVNSTIIEDNFNVKSIIVRGDSKPDNPLTDSWIRNNSGTGSITRPCYVKENMNVGFTLNPCRPADTSSITPNFQVQLLVPSQDTTVYSNTLPIRLPIRISTNRANTGDSVHILQAAQPWVSYSAQQFSAQGTGFVLDTTLEFTAYGYYSIVAALDGPEGQDYSGSKVIRVLDTVLFTSLPNRIEPSTKTLLIYPNPAQAQIVVEGMSNQPFRYEIYSTDGKRQLIGTSERQINVDQLPSGFYILKAFQGQNIATGKFSKH